MWNFSRALVSCLRNWFEYRLENDPRFLERVEKVRKNLRASRGVRLDEL
jgi:hypothetical protein